MTADDIMVRSRFVHDVGAALEEKRPGYARMALETTQAHAGRDGNVHSGVLTALLDSALAIALRELRGEGASLHSSVEMNTSFLAPVPIGDGLVIEGSIFDLQQAVAFGEGEARSDGEVIAKARVTFALQQSGV